MIDTPPPDSDLPGRPADAAAAAGRPLVIPVIEEVAVIGKRRVESGRLRVRKLVHEDVVTVDECGTVEELQVERVAVDRVLDGPVGIRHEGDVMVVPVVEERLVTLKQRVLVEELRITRITRVRPLPLQVTLRREEVVVERFDLDSGQWHAVDRGATDDEPPRC